MDWNGAGRTGEPESSSYGQECVCERKIKRCESSGCYYLCIFAAVDRDIFRTQPVFEQAHQDALVKQSGAVIDRLITDICRLSGLTQGATESAEKN